MKILITAPYFYPHKGGLENFCLEVSSRLVQKDFYITVLTSRVDNSPKFEVYRGINIYRLESVDTLGGTYPIIKFGGINRSIWKKLSKQNFDVVITNTRFFLLSFMGQWFAKKNKIRSFHIEHGTCHPQLKNPIARFCAYFYDHTLGRITIKMAYKNLAISSASAEFSQTLGAKKVEIVYNSIDTNFFKPNPKVTRKDIVVYIGRLIEGKGVQDLIKAFKMINEQSFELHIVGAGNYRNELEKIASDDKRIFFLGEKNGDQIKKILNESKIFVNPSYSEGFPTSVLEAGSMGTAVIATDVGGTREIINNNVNGFLISPHDAKTLREKLQTLMSDRYIADRFSSAIENDVKQFDWSRNCNKISKLLYESTK